MSAAYNSTFLKFNTAQFLNVAKIEKTKEGERKGENKKGQSSWRGRGKGEKGGEYIYIPRSSTRTSGHEMQKLKINS